MGIDEAYDIVEMLVDDIRDRSGLGDEWDRMSVRAQREIMDCWVRKIMEG